MPNKRAMDIAVAYYEAMNDKDINKIASYLHQDVKFLSPVYDLKGKESVLQTIKGFLNIFTSLKIRVKFGNEVQSMLAYDLECPAPIGLYRSAALITVNNELITNIELFFDTSPMKR